MQKLFGVCPSSVLYTSKMRRSQVEILVTSVKEKQYKRIKM